MSNFQKTMMSNQDELKKLYEDGKTCIWQFNTLWSIEYHQNYGDFGISKIKTRNASIGVTRKGRYIAMKPAEAWQYI